MSVTPEPLPPMAAAVSLERADVARLLPHNGQWLLVDHVDIVQGADGIEAIGTMRAQPDICDGHFGLLPGIVWLELANQVAAAAMAHHQNITDLRAIFLGGGPYRFSGRVKVGQIIAVKVTITVVSRRRISYSAEGRVEGNDTIAFTSSDQHGSLVSPAFFEKLVE